MPIKPENRHYYGEDWKKDIRPRILERENNCCKFCGVENHSTVRRQPGTDQCKVLITGAGRVLDWIPHYKYENAGWKVVRIILTVAHLDQDPSNHSDDNLAALC